MITLSWAPSAKQLRQFAWFCPVGFTLIGYLLTRLGLEALWMYAGAGLGLFLLGVGLAKPLALRPLYALIMAIATPIGWLVSTTLMLVFHMVVLGLVGRVFRLFGRDPFHLYTRAGASQWRARSTESDPSGYYRQT
jgi:hypothetical protein